MERAYLLALHHLGYYLYVFSPYGGQSCGTFTHTTTATKLFPATKFCKDQGSEAAASLTGLSPKGGSTWWFLFTIGHISCCAEWVQWEWMSYRGNQLSTLGDSNYLDIMLQFGLFSLVSCMSLQPIHWCQVKSTGRGLVRVRAFFWNESFPWIND